MSTSDRRKHWETIYKTKTHNEVSWFQPTPETSLDFFDHFKLPKTAKIIDIGGGDSLLVDHLLELGYTNISVLDISATALERAKQRLGVQAKQVTWILADITTFKPTEKYDFWHDRATFHFLTSEDEIKHYLHTVQQSLNAKGILVLGTFSTNGPEKCSGLEIKQYSETIMAKRLHGIFEKIRCVTVDHQTPADTLQNFVFCSFKIAPVV